MIPPRYAFVQRDETDGKDYLIELDGHPLAGDQVAPTGNRYPVDGDGIRLLSPSDSFQGLRSGQEL
ncbi:2-hydroxyhepta-2,4-diene-1,7-dioate isomerase [Bifidobacterium bifidum]|nr:2-hydroxyhepta-2,4-diene-1,7-dioate isomerase [Bifidobacterium bifidum]